MAKIKKGSSDLLNGLLGVGSGTALPIEFQSDKVIKGLREPIKIKRRNQYVAKHLR
jgi:5'-3' exonuclease